jgi:hypothetical protein
MLTVCGWCKGPMTPRDGKEFCSPSCRTEYHAACRDYGHMQRMHDFVSIETLRAIRKRARTPCTANTGDLEHKMEGDSGKW